MKHLQWFIHHLRLLLHHHLRLLLHHHLGLLSHHHLFIFILILTVGLFTTDHIHIDRIQFTQKDGDSICKYFPFAKEKR